MSVSEITFRAYWKYDNTALKEMKRDVDSAKEKVVSASTEMDVSYKKLGVSIAHVGTAGLALEGIWTRVAKGQMNILEGIIRTIPAMITMASAISTITSAEAARTAATIASTLADWGHVFALKAKAIALAIVQALSGPVGWAILAGAVGAAAIGVGLAAGIPEKTGIYTKASPLKFITGPLAGTTINEGASIVINISGAGSPRETGDAVVDALRRAGAI